MKSEINTLFNKAVRKNENFASLQYAEKVVYLVNNLYFDVAKYIVEAMGKRAKSMYV